MKHLAAIQDKVPFPLLVVMPHPPGGEAIPPIIDTLVNQAISDIDSKKKFRPLKYYFGGHSLGGASIAGWAGTNSGKVKGVFMWGSYINKAT